MKKNIKQKTLQGVKWTFIQQFSGQAVSLLVFVILARLLKPEDFGLVALASSFLGFLGPFINQGFGQAIIQRENIEPQHLDTAFWVNTAIGLVFTLGGVLSAHLIARLFGQAELGPVVAILSLNFIVLSLSGVQQAIVRREMKFKILAKRSIAAQFAGGVVGVTMAFTGFGVWALVGRQLVDSLVALMLLWGLSSWRPAFRFSTRHLKDLWSFGINVMGSELLRLVNRRSDNLLIGYFLGTVALGHYTVAYRLLKIVYTLVSLAVTKVGMPAFARIQSDQERVKRAFYKITEMTALAAFPAFLVLLVSAPQLVPKLFGQQWLPSIPVMQVLCVVGIAQCLYRPMIAVIIGLGRADWRFWLQLVDGIMTVVAFFVAVQWGIVAVAIAYVVVGYIQMPLWFWTVKRLVPVSVSGCLAALRAPLVSATAMIIIFYAFRYLLSSHVPLIIEIGSAVLVAIFVYVFTIYRFFPMTAFRITEILNTFIKRQRNMNS